MKSVKILGSGCANCEKLAKEARVAASNLGIEIELIKVQDYAEIAAYGVMSTPGLVVDEVVKSSGKVHCAKEIELLL